MSCPDCAVCRFQAVSGRRPAGGEAASGLPREAWALLGLQAACNDWTVWSSDCKQLATIGLSGLRVASSLQRSDCLVFRLQAACKTGTGQSFNGKLAEREPLAGSDGATASLNDGASRDPVQRGCDDGVSWCQRRRLHATDGRAIGAACAKLLRQRCGLVKVSAAIGMPCGTSDSIERCW